MHSERTDPTSAARALAVLEALGRRPDARDGLGPRPSAVGPAEALELLVCAGLLPWSLIDGGAEWWCSDCLSPPGMWRPCARDCGSRAAEPSDVETAASVASFGSASVARAVEVVRESWRACAACVGAVGDREWDSVAASCRRNGPRALRLEPARVPASCPSGREWDPFRASWRAAHALSECGASGLVLYELSEPVVCVLFPRVGAVSSG